MVYYTHMVTEGHKHSESTTTRIAHTSYGVERCRYVPTRCLRSVRVRGGDGASPIFRHPPNTCGAYARC